MFQLDPEASVLELLEEPDNDESGASDEEERNPQCVSLTARSRVKDYLQRLQPRECTVDTLSSDFVSTESLSEDQRDFVEVATKGQSGNKTWVLLRKGMITASDFHRVASRVNTLTKDPSADPAPLLRHLMGDSCLDEAHLPASLRWGRKREEDARRIYARVERKAHKRLCVTTSGLVISQHHSLIGCSPDAFVQCACSDHPDNRWLLEIKCPFTQKDKSPKEAALHCGCEMKDGELSLKVNHPHYTQVQGQLGITQRSRCERLETVEEAIEALQKMNTTVVFQKAREALRRCSSCVIS